MESRHQVFRFATVLMPPREGLSPQPRSAALGKLSVIKQLNHVTS